MNRYVMYTSISFLDDLDFSVSSTFFQVLQVVYCGRISEQKPGKFAKAILDVL